MSSELEGLIAALLVLISCGGEQGCSVTDVVDAIHTPSKTHHGPSQHNIEPPNEDPGFRHRTASTIWKWLVARRDVSVGPDRKYNLLSLDEVLALSPSLSPTAQDANGQDSTSEPTENIEKHANHVRVSVSEETMWESLTGHAVDYKRVPRSEWLLLLGIASTTSDGILQGDLGRLVDQDKRSVPKRTDALLKKGYIAKRTTLVRGTKTSKMWLKMFAPSLAKDGETTDEPRAEMNFTRQILVESLDPVPWHVRWTGESVDYTALATTIMAITTEWGVLRVQDLKSKLGVLGMRWQMKVLAKVCRFLNSRGVIQYVAAKLGDKVFKDCIKHLRDLNAEDWSIFLATGKRTTKPSRNPDVAGEATDGKSLYGLSGNAAEVASSPPWELDKPLTVTIVEMAQRLGERGLSNPDVYGLTLGSSFSRYLSSMTSALATPGLQPSHLTHFQLRSEHTRTGKIASYRYYGPPPNAPVTTDPQEHTGSEVITEKDGSDTSQPANSPYGFAPAPTSSMSSTSVTTLVELCASKSSDRKPKGRPKKQQKTLKVDRRDKEVESNKNLTEETPRQTEPLEADTTQPSVETSKSSALPKDGQVENVDATQDNIKTHKLVVTLKVSSVSLRNLLEEPPSSPLRPRRTRGRASLEETPVESPSRPRRTRAQAEQPVMETPPPARRTRATRASLLADGNADGNVDSPVLPLEENGENGAAEEDITNADQDSNGSKKRGRPKRGSKKGQSASTTSTAKPWKCEKCGGAWKNDIGLKYHVEKSRTSCNPSYDENAEPTPRRRKRAPSEPATPTQAGLETPQNGELAASEQDAGPDANIDEAPPPSVSKPQPRRRVVATPRVDSRPSVSLTGGPLLAIPEWRRPPVTNFLSPEKTPIPSTNGGALVQSSASLLRPALGPSSGRKSGSGTPKQAPNKTPYKDEKPSTDAAVDELAECGVPEVIAKELVPSKAVDSLLPKVTVSSRLSDIINALLEEQDGVFPGGRGMWHAITVRWGEKFSTEPAPTTRSYQAAVRELVKNKVVTEHWHAFRDSKGFFCKCPVIVLKSKDPFCEEALNLVEKAKATHPATYIPSPFEPLPATASAKDLRRGRRQLAEEVETLDAPVYAAQAAAAKMPDEPDEADGPPRRKRRKTRAADGPSSPVSPNKGFNGWADMDQPDYIPQPVWTEGSQYLSGQRSMDGIEFLDPNTFLREESPERPSKRRRSSEDVAEEECVVDPRLISEESPAVTTFEQASYLSGFNGTWPYMSLLDFETQGGSFVLKGWMPDANWFSWAEIIEEIERRTNTISRMRRKTGTSTDPLERFMDRLIACLEVERAWTESFISSPPNSSGPHNIFIKFFAGRHGPVLLPSEPITWPKEAQLVPDSFVSPGPVAAAAAAAAAEGDDDEDEQSSSSEDEYTFEWPRLRPRPAGSARRGRPPKEVSRRHDHLPRSQIKRVELVSRTLTPLPPKASKSKDAEDSNPAEDAVEDPERLLAAFIAVRVLLGGADKCIDWGLLLELFPKMSIIKLRRFWLSARKQQGAYVAKLTKDFQDKFLVAYEKDELPEMDFDEPLEYDWHCIIEWTLRLRRRVGVELPSTQEGLKEQFTSHRVPAPDDDWREKFFHPQASVFSRFEASTTAPAAVPVPQRYVDEDSLQNAVTDLDVARSWVRSLCCTDETRYTPSQIKMKFSTLANGNAEENNKLLKQAIAGLTHQRVICKSKKPPLGGRPYRLNESYTYTLGKLAQQQKFQEAFIFKAKLDATFRRGETIRVPYTLDDGSVLALTNLNASGRINLKPVEVPDIPMGFEPGNYESRKFPKSYYHFGIEVIPTETYEYSEGVKVLKLAAEVEPPSEGSRGELAQWIDFFGKRDPERWTQVLGAFCFIYATRGLLRVEGICTALKPVLEEFEARMIIDWGKKTGVLKEAEDGMGVMVGEWWWLAVPWQFRQRLARTEL